MAILETYPKISRLPIGKIVPRKPYLTVEQANKLLLDRVSIEEKMDGKTARFETGRYVIFAEDLKVTHSIQYKIPARFALIDVFDKSVGRFVSLGQRREIYRDMKVYPAFFKGVKSDAITFVSGQSFFFPPILETGFVSLDEIKNFISYSKYGRAYNISMEGVVVKMCRSEYPSILRAAKLVSIEFTDGIELHYSRKHRKLNIISPSVQEYEFGPQDQSKIFVPRSLLISPNPRQ